MKTMVGLNTPYDLVGLVSAAKKDLQRWIMQIIVYSLSLVLSVLAIVFYGTHLIVFIIGIIVFCAAVLLLFKAVRKINLSDYSHCLGEAIKVHKEIKIVDTKSVGGINMFGVRKYDTYQHDEIRLTVFMRDGECAKSYYLRGVTEEHARYYEAKGKLIHIWGTHFPVRLEIADDEWLCPCCGEFNANEERVCTRCARKIIK